MISRDGWPVLYMIELSTLVTLLQRRKSANYNFEFARCTSQRSKAFALGYVTMMLINRVQVTPICSYNL